VKITLSLDEQLVKRARKIAAQRDTTLTALVREFLQTLIAEHGNPGRRQRELNALHQAFKKYSFKMGKRTWTRAELHERH